MERQRQRSNGGRRRRRKARSQPTTNAEPVLIAARRPNSPRLATEVKVRAVASAQPKIAKDGPAPTGSDRASKTGEGAPQRREARIVQLRAGEGDDRQRERERLLGRLMLSEGRAAISRAAELFIEAGFDFPAEQEVQLKLLEHFDEDRARHAIGVLSSLVARETPLSRPVFEQRLRRLEEHADEAATRQAAATLRRALRA